MGWRWVGREAQDGGAGVYLQLIHVADRNQHNIESTIFQLKKTNNNKMLSEAPETPLSRLQAQSLAEMQSRNRRIGVEEGMDVIGADGLASWAGLCKQTMETSVYMCQAHWEAVSFLICTPALWSSDHYRCHFSADGCTKRLTGLVEQAKYRRS